MLHGVMQTPPLPPREAERLAALASYDVLDTPPDPAFDGITRVVAHILDVPMALVSLVDADRQWFKSRYGLHVTETPRDVSFCGHVVAHDRPLVVTDALADVRFADNPLVSGPPRVRFYAGFPLRHPDGHVLGTLCALDSRAREVDPHRLELLEILADDVMAQLELRRQHRLLERERTRLRTVLEAAADAILTVDDDAMVQDVNSATERLFGYPREEVVGLAVGVLLPDTHAREDERPTRRLFSVTASPAVGPVREVVARRKDGSTFPCDLAVGNMNLGGKRFFTCILRDITRRKLAEELREEARVDLEKSRDDLLHVLDQLRVGTVIVDGAGYVVFSSKASFMEPGTAMVGKRWEAALDVEEPARRAIRAAVAQPENARRRVELRLGRDNSQRWVELEVRDDPRDPAGRIFYLYDVSDVHDLRKRLTHERRGRLVGDSEAMREVYESISQVAQGDWTVLVEGETGTGKELVAQAIHQASTRRSGPFVAVNCAGLTESILGSQLFGHVRGAFTGAVSDREGVFEAAGGGTLFLDEIGDVALPVQSALLRALQEREITRLGETRPRKVDVRIVTATNRDLHKLVSQGLFRQDLLYRILAARLRVPPLRDRRQDVPLLVASFLAEERVTAGKLVADVSQEAMAQLTRYHWPGNVRELRGAVEYAVVRCRGRRIEVEDLPAEVAQVGGASPAGVAPVAPDNERDRVVAALRRAGGNRAKAARLLGMGRATLYRRLRDLDIRPAEIAGGE
jgi:PAS domain S-box-containing protein